MNDYWIGVLFGFFAGLVFFMVCLFVLSYRINSLQGEFNELKVEHDQLSEWVRQELKAVRIIMSSLMSTSRSF